MKEVLNNGKLKRLCTQCVSYDRKLKRCPKNPKHCSGGHTSACGQWLYRYRKEGKFYCLYYREVVDNGVCETCAVRCIRSESRKEMDYFGKDIEG